MESRPKIKPELTTADKLVEIAGWFAILGTWILILTNYAELPDTIPTHYNGAGKVDRVGGKGTMIALPVVSTILFIGLTILNRFPHIFNYPAAITPDNALRQYTIATRLLRYLKLIIMVIFGLIVFETIQITKGESEGFGIWFLPLTLGAIFIPVIAAVVRSMRVEKK